MLIEAPDHVPDLRRVKALYAAIFALLMIIIMRLWFLQIVKGPELADQAATQRTRRIRRVAPRGTILDSRGVVLATSHSHYVVSVVPEEIKKNPQTVVRLAQLLHTTVEDLNDLIKTNKSTPFDPVPVAPVPDGDLTLPSQVEEQKIDLPGVLITKDPVRFYLDNRICAHVLGVTRPISEQRLNQLRARGYRGGDYLGVEGIEKTYEKALRGVDGGQMIAVDARGRMQHNLDEVKPKQGNTLRLTIDSKLQRVAYDALQEPLAHGHPGSAVALDPNTGAVLALVSVPSYDLNQYGSQYARLLKDPNRPLIDRAAGSHYPCGSTFKLITTAAGLDTGTITANTTDYCSGSMRLGRRVFHCDKLSGHGVLDLADALGQSCDVYFWHAAQRIGQQRLSAWARQFGLGTKTGIDLPVDAAGIVPSPQWKKKHRMGPWVQGDLLNMSIGQGYVGATPLQLVDYTAAIANGGTLWKPKLVFDVTDLSSGSPKIKDRLMPESRGELGLSRTQLDAIIQGMTRAFERKGTAYGCGIPDMEIAGKTGTAEAFIKGKKVSHSVFVCFAPVKNPKIAIAVLVEGGGFGASTAAPIARRMLGQFFGRHLQNLPIGVVKYGAD